MGLFEHCHALVDVSLRNGDNYTGKFVCCFGLGLWFINLYLVRFFAQELRRPFKVSAKMEMRTTGELDAGVSAKKAVNFWLNLKIIAEMYIVWCNFILRMYSVAGSRQSWHMWRGWEETPATTSGFQVRNSDRNIYFWEFSFQPWSHFSVGNAMRVLERKFTTAPTIYGGTRRISTKVRHHFYTVKSFWKTDSSLLFFWTWYQIANNYPAWKTIPFFLFFRVGESLCRAVTRHSPFVSMPDIRPNSHWNISWPRTLETDPFCRQRVPCSGWHRSLHQDS